MLPPTQGVVDDIRPGSTGLAPTSSTNLSKRALRARPMVLTLVPAARADVAVDDLHACGGWKLKQPFVPLFMMDSRQPRAHRFPKT